MEYTYEIEIENIGQNGTAKTKIQNSGRRQLANQRCVEGKPSKVKVTSGRQ